MNSIILIDFFYKKTDGQGGSETSSNKSEKLHRDLDQTCLKTVVSLLRQLPLQPPDAVHESDLSGVKSRLFYKYFSFFIKLLNRCRILEVEIFLQQSVFFDRIIYIYSIIMIICILY